MLRSITIDNFKSLINVTYELGALNLVIGENNSGKTNLCQAMRFLTLTTSLPLIEAAAHATGETWNIPNVYFDKPTIDLKCTCELPVKNETLTFDYSLSIEIKELVSNSSPAMVMFKAMGVQSETLQVSGGPFNSITLLKNDGGKVTLLNEKSFLELGPVYSGGEGIKPEPLVIETTCPVERTALSQLFALETNIYANAFKKYLGSWLYYDLDVRQLRKPDAKPFDLLLNPDGSNLASVLYNLNNINPRLLRKITETVRILEPKLDWINFMVPTQDQVYMFFEDDKANRFSVTSVSNGTLRFLALIFIILSMPTKDQNWKQPSWPIVIEEPEDGIYVGHLKELVEFIDPSGATGQFIFTSHAPYFIDLFDAHLENVVVMKRGKTHSQLVKPDPERLKKYLVQKEFPLGELHFRDMIA
jgi:predicted ATPase